MKIGKVPVDNGVTVEMLKWATPSNPRQLFFLTPTLFGTLPVTPPRPRNGPLAPILASGHCYYPTLETKTPTQQQK